MEVAANFNHETDIFHVNLPLENVPELPQAGLGLITELWLQDLDNGIPRPNRADNVEEDEGGPSNDNAVAHDLGHEQDNARDQQLQQPAQNADMPDIDRANRPVTGEEEPHGDEDPASQTDGRPGETPAPQPPMPTAGDRSTWGHVVASIFNGLLYGPSFFFSAVTTSREVQVGHCVVCNDDVRSFIRVPCKDVYCIACVRQLFELATNDESLMPPRCCRKEIPLNLVTSHLPATLRNRFVRKLEEHKTLNRLYCIKPSCAAFIGSADGRRRTVSCPACYTRVCTSCKKDAHPLYTACKQDRETANAIEFCRQQGWQRCPGCQTMIELSHGCYHMTCVCRTEFCYLCRARWKSCTCTQWDEQRLLIAAEARVRDEIRRAAPIPVLPPQVINRPVQRADHLQFVNRLQAQVQRPPLAPNPIRLAQTNNNRPRQPANYVPVQIPTQHAQNNANRPILQTRAVMPLVHVPDQIPRPLIVPNPIRPVQNIQPVQWAVPVMPVPDRRPSVVPNPIIPVQNIQPVQRVVPVMPAVPDRRPSVVPNPIRPVQNNQPVQRAGPVNVTSPVGVRDQVQRPRSVVVPTVIRPVENTNQPVPATPAVLEIRRAGPAAPVIPEIKRPLIVPNPPQPTSINLPRRTRDQTVHRIASPQTEDFGARVRAMMEHLRENHDCQHPHWYRETGAAKCESCYHRLDKFILMSRMQNAGLRKVSKKPVMN